MMCLIKPAARNIPSSNNIRRLSNQWILEKFSSVGNRLRNVFISDHLIPAMLLTMEMESVKLSETLCAQYTIFY